MSVIQSAARRITLNSLWLLIGRAASHGLMLIFTVLVARSLGEAGLGQYAFIASVVFLGNIVTTFGMDTLLIRDIAGTRRIDTTLLPAAFAIQIALSVAFIAVVSVVAERLANTIEMAGALKLYSLALLPLAVATIFSAVLRAYERMDLFLLFNLTKAVVQTGGAFVIFGTGGGLNALVWLLLLVEVIGALVAGALCANSIPEFELARVIKPLAIHRVVGTLPATIRAGGVLGILAILAVVYQRMGILTLSLMTTDAVTGWYSAAARVTEAFKMVPYAVFGALFPVMARQAFSDKDQVITLEAGTVFSAEHYNLAMGALLGFVLAASVGTTLLAEFGIDALFGSAYAPAAQALQILIWGLLPFVITLKLSFELVAAGREMKALYAMLATTVTAVVLYLVLVPAYGLAGACWATVLAETAQAGILAATHRLEIPAHEDRYDAIPDHTGQA